ncbi:DUF2800 domain-containing protein [Pseudolactococcus insecticola]|uniref:Nuclease n=1 Tax=Pseudolactococcus insecticola TaxID=2709158 RepID=A0A6A0B4I0_9LACT|nr:DUF2800 domain-containing protein [Lactococcus insecticola]GFH40260.1 hypothetical protein Hs20B_06580 [Lactococcus insecticola]
MKYALLSASSSSRWIHCPPSARLGENFENKTSEYAKQGTDAHSLCEFKLQQLLGIKARAPTLEYYDEEMADCAESYATYVMEEMAKAKETCSDPVVIIEQKLDFSRFVPEGFGTGDCLIIADGTLSVIDMKYGLGVLVDATENPQMMCYALGALELFDGIYDINEVKMTIFQPRRENISTYTLPKDKLIKWANELLTPASELAFKGEGEFNCGKWCKFCPAKNVCRKRADYNLELARLEFKKAETLSNAEIEEVLAKVDDLVSWATDVKEYALKQALSGKEWTNYKLVEGRSNRKYVNDEEVATAVVTAGFDPYEKKLLGITAMTKSLGKKKFEEILGGLVEKPRGKLTLVPTADKRQAVVIANVKDEFNEIMEEK